MSPGQEDARGKEMATHSSILVWRIPWTEEPGGLQSMGSQKVRLNRATKQQNKQHDYLVLSPFPFVENFLFPWKTMPYL